MYDLRVLILDVETSGMDPRTMEILELSVMRYGEPHPNQTTWRFRNTRPIDPRSTEIHGITAASLADEPLFIHHMDEVAALWAYADVLVGYNIDFDLRAIEAQYRSHGRDPAWKPGMIVVDLYRLWQLRERRSLQDAYRRFVGREMSGAHRAEADVAATGELLMHMGMAFNFAAHPNHPDSAAHYAKLAEECSPRKPEYVGSKHLIWKDGRVVVNFGKHAGTDLRKVPGGYTQWMMASANLPADTVEVVRRCRESREQEFYDWLTMRWPPPVTGSQEVQP